MENGRGALTCHHRIDTSGRSAVEERGYPLFLRPFGCPAQIALGAESDLHRGCGCEEWMFANVLILLPGVWARFSAEAFPLTEAMIRSV